MEAAPRLRGDKMPWKLWQREHSDLPNNEGRWDQEESVTGLDAFMHFNNLINIKVVTDTQKKGG